MMLLLHSTCILSKLEFFYPSEYISHNEKEKSMKAIILKITAGVAFLVVSFSVAAGNSYYTKQFKKIDANNDGSLDIVEFRENSNMWMDKRVAQGDDSWASEVKRVRVNRNQFNKKDTDGNEAISLEEFVADR